MQPIAPASLQLQHIAANNESIAHYLFLQAIASALQLPV
jgi:hypothetical protein